MSQAELWYVSYGSNMCLARLRCYLEGGRPPGAKVTYAGARDATLPRQDAAVMLPGRLYFAGESPVWGGGVAFYDHSSPAAAASRTPARAWRITTAQFADVAAQEMHRLPTADDPLERILLGPLPGGQHRVGPGNYETLVHLGERDGLAMYTFTSPHGYDAVPHTRPSAAYLAMLAEGLREAHGWSQAQVTDHFARLLGRATVPD
ncbi:histone deacetylase [Nocardioides sp. AE5]|uniref:histone deacetylase n=1 Tax=Nocardioides sp. AE5 TaxID=2962573 RepID=UPI002881E003|nr:histone deacetylase [Nocardioides sp. AE5]MDT0202138.1 histone deacetylase [Nocardioides sp. AE5]